MISLRAIVGAVLLAGGFASGPAAEDKNDAAKEAPTPEVSIPVQRVAAPYQVPTVSPKISLEEAMYVPPKFRSRVKPVYPYELLRDGVTGTAKVGCFIDQNGSVLNTQVMEATRPEFGAALVAAVEASSFAMATNEGEPIPTILGFAHTFSRQAPNAAELRADEQLLERVTKRPRSLGRPRELDEPLRLKTQPAPAYPTAMLTKNRSGEAVIEFLLDERGRARLPRILSATDPAFGYAAAQAVAQWEFEPTTTKGTLAVMRVIVPFRFDTTSR